MINKKEEIYSELLKVCNDISDTYPTNWGTFPCIQYLEEENSPHEIANNEETQSYLRYKVDIWDKVSTSVLALAVNDVFFQMGLKRTTSVDMAEPDGLKHKVMRFEGILDIDTDIVHQR